MEMRAAYTTDYFLRRVLGEPQRHAEPECTSSRKLSAAVFVGVFGGPPMGAGHSQASATHSQALATYSRALTTWMISLGHVETFVPTSLPQEVLSQHEKDVQSRLHARHLEDDAGVGDYVTCWACGWAFGIPT